MSENDFVQILTLDSQYKMFQGFSQISPDFRSLWSFVLLFKDLIRLFGYYNDGIIYLLQKFFEMKKQQCKDGLEIYKKYLVRMEKIQSFLKVAENVSQNRFNTQYMVRGASV